ncbi:MAG: LamG-like jellyroll fold domain-containing protein [Hormoscilla sp.]
MSMNANISLETSAANLNRAISETQALLKAFVRDDRFRVEDLTNAFHAGVHEEEFSQLLGQFELGDFSGLPNIEMRSRSDTGGALGVYVADTDMIYLAEDFLENSTISQIVEVLLEEIGHAIDARINATDSAGDEGAIFSALVRGVDLSEAQLEALHRENDRIQLVIDGQTVMAEAATIMVDTLNDTEDSGDGVTSLREALASATSGDTITFDSGGTITLGGSQLEITKDVTIDGDIDNEGTPDITIDADGQSRVFNIDDGSTTQIAVSLEGLTITGGSISGNDDGGGIYNSESLSITNSTISNNSTGTGNNPRGGGINNNSGIVVITNSTISGNSAGADGGGIENFLGTMTIANSTISNNSAAGYDGGGIDNIVGTMTIANSTISGNSAGDDGGGVKNSGMITITNSTISGNSAGDDGGGVNVSSSGLSGFIPYAYLASTIVADNTAGISDNDLFVDASGTISARNSLIERDSDQINGTNTDNITGVDPLLDPNGLQDNGGSTETIALQSDSPAIDTGSNPNGLTSDQRGDNLREFGAGVDIGAFEYQLQIASISDYTATIYETSADFGKALALDGDEDYVALPELGFSGGNTSVSVSAWFKVNESAGERNNIFGFGQDGSTRETFSIRTRGDGGFRFYFWGDDLDVDVDPYYGEWTHVAATYDDTSEMQSVYVNGSLAGERQVSSTPNFANKSYRIGGFNDEYFDGSIDEVRIWEAALTAEEIQDNLYSPLTGTEKDLVAYYSFEDDATTIADQSGNENNGTLQGGAFDESLSFIGYVDLELSSEVFSEPGIIVNYTIESDTASEGDDFYQSQLDISTTDGVDPTNSIFIPQGEDTGRIYLTALPDAIAEDDEELTLRLVSDFDDALSLDGDGDYVDVPDGTWFNGDLTIEAWVYVRNYNNWSRLLDFGNGRADDNVLVALSNGTSGQPRFGVHLGDDPSNLESPVQLPLDSWSHIAVTLSNTTGIMYINGEQVAINEAMNIPAGETRTQNYLGRSNWSSDADADALFDDVRIWDVARTEEEIKANRYNTLVGDEDNLVAYYRFDDGYVSIATTEDATVEDVTGNGNDGKFRGDATITADNSDRNNVLTLDGDGDYIELPNLELSGDTSVSVSAWINVNAGAEDRNNIFGFGNAGENGEVFSIRTRGDGSFRFYFWADDLDVNVNDYYGTWTHVAATYDATSGMQSVYVNGSLVGEPRVATPDFANDNYRIGGFNDEYFDGSLDDVGIWNKALNSEEIDDIINNNITEDGLLAYYDFDKYRVQDATGNGNDGIFYGGVTEESVYNDPFSIDGEGPTYEVDSAQSATITIADSNAYTPGVIVADLFNDEISSDQTENLINIIDDSWEFQVKLASEPTEDVTIDLSTTLGNLDTNSLTFTSDDWTRYQTVTVTNFSSEAAFDLSVTATSNDANYSSAETIAITPTDEVLKLAVTEGGTTQEAPIIPVGVDGTSNAIEDSDEPGIFTITLGDEAPEEGLRIPFSVTSDTDTDFEVVGDEFSLNEAFTFDGVDDYIEFSDSSVGGAFDGGSSAFSITGWINPDALGSTVLANASSSAAGNIELGIDASGNLNLTLDTDADTDTTLNLGNGAIAAGDWQFFGLTLDDSNNGLELDGIDDYVELNPIPATIAAGEALTIEHWIKPDATDAQILFYTGDNTDENGFNGNGSHLHTGINSGGSFTFVYDDDDNDLILIADTSLNAGQWYHLAVSFELGSSDADGELKMYIDGEQVTFEGGQSSLAINSLATTNLDFSRFGRPGSSERYFDGEVDELRVWNVVRTASEIENNRFVSLTGNEPGLVTYYTFDERDDGTIADGSGNGNDGTIEGSPSFAPSLGTVTAYINQPDESNNALELDGIDDYVELNPIPATIAAGEALTIEHWVKPDATDAQILFYTGDDTDENGFNGPGSHLHTGINNGGSFTFVYDDDDNDHILIADTSLNAGQWYHLAASFELGSDDEDGELKMYIDGEQVTFNGGQSSLAIDSSATTALNFSRFGRPGSSERYFGGEVDELRVWNVVRTASEIQNNRFLSLTGNESGLVTYYTFDESNNGTIADGSGNGNDGTLQGAPSFAPSLLRNRVTADEETTSGSSLADPGDTPFTIGASLNNSSFFDGAIDNLAIWDRALTQEEVESLTYQTLTGAEDNLVFYSDGETLQGDATLVTSSLEDSGFSQNIVEFAPGETTAEVGILPINGDDIDSNTNDDITLTLEGSNSVLYELTTSSAEIQLEEDDEVGIIFATLTEQGILDDRAIADLIDIELLTFNSSDDGTTATANFRVRLTEDPTAEVTVTITDGNGTDSTSFTFDSTNWDDYQQTDTNSNLDLTFDSSYLVNVSASSTDTSDTTYNINAMSLPLTVAEQATEISELFTKEADVTVTTTTIDIEFADATDLTVTADSLDTVNLQISASASFTSATLIEGQTLEFDGGVELIVEENTDITNAPTPVNVSVSTGGTIATTDVAAEIPLIATIELEFADATDLTVTAGSVETVNLQIMANSSLTSATLTQGQTLVFDGGVELIVTEDTDITDAPTPVNVYVSTSGTIATTDAASITTTEETITTTSTYSTTFAVGLQSEPTSDVTFDLEINDAGTNEGIFDSDTTTRSLTFTPDNWDSYQEVTLYGVEDHEVDGDQTYSISVTNVSNNDGPYESETGTLSVTNEDIDEAVEELDSDESSLISGDIVASFTQSKVEVNEDGTVDTTFTVSLSEEAPAGGLIVNFEFVEGLGTATLGEDTQVLFSLASVDNFLGEVEVSPEFGAQPVFVDIDGDGDEDAFIGSSKDNGGVTFFQNQGTRDIPSFEEISNGEANEITGDLISLTASSGALAFVDLDGNGVFDALTSEADPADAIDAIDAIAENLGNLRIPMFVDSSTSNNSLENIIGNSSTSSDIPPVPAFVDIDDDGDEDLFITLVEQDTEKIVYYINDGSTDDPFGSATSNDFNDLLADGQAAISSEIEGKSIVFEDIDNDGDFDAFIGKNSGEIVYYENVPDEEGMAEFQLKTEESFLLRNVNIGSTSRLAFTDIDSDGDVDAFVGSGEGYVTFYEGGIGQILIPEEATEVTVDLNELIIDDAIAENTETFDIELLAHIGKATLRVVRNYNPTDGTIGLQLTDEDNALASTSYTIPAGSHLSFTVGGEIVTIAPVSDVTLTQDTQFDIEVTVSEGDATSLSANSSNPITTVFDVTDYEVDETAKTLSVTILDDDEALVNISETSFTTSENGTTSSSFTVTLDSEPTEPVTVYLGTNDTSEGLLAQTVDLQITEAYDSSTGEIGLRIDNSGIYGLVFDAGSTLVFGDGSTATVSETTIVYNSDEGADVPITGDSADLTNIASLAEEDDTGSLVGELDVTGSLVGELVELGFDATNWDEAQTVTIIAQDDDVEDGDISYEIRSTVVSADIKYHEDTVPLEVLAYDASTATVTVQIDSLRVRETTLAAGTSLKFANGTIATVDSDSAVELSNTSSTEVSLTLDTAALGAGAVSTGLVSNADSDNVSAEVRVTQAYDPNTGTIGLELVDPGNLRLEYDAGTTIIFENGATITLDDAVSVRSTNEKLVSVTLNASNVTIPVGETTRFTESISSDITVTNSDDDTAGVTIAINGDALAEGVENNFFSVVLNSEPTGEVNLILSPSDNEIQLEDEFDGTRYTATFDETNWNIPQTIEVTAVDDFEIEYNHSSTITFDLESDDDFYNEDSLVADKEVQIFIEDNDFPVANVEAVAGAIEANAPGYFAITLNQAVSDDFDSTGIVVNYRISGTADADGDETNETDDLQPISGSARIAPGQRSSPLIAFPIDDFKVEGVDLIVNSAATITSGGGAIELEIDVFPFMGSYTAGADTIELQLDTSSDDEVKTILSGGTTLILPNGEVTVATTAIVSNQESTIVELSETDSNSFSDSSVYQQIDLPAGTELKLGDRTVSVREDATVTNESSTSVTVEFADDLTDALDVADGDTTQLQGEIVTVTLDSGDNYEIGDADSASMTIQDNDKPGVRIVEIGGVTTVEEGASSGSEFFVSLLSQPESEVELTLSNSTSNSANLNVLSYDGSNIALQVADTEDISALTLPVDATLTFFDSSGSELGTGTIDNEFFVDDTDEGTTDEATETLTTSDDLSTASTATYSYTEFSFPEGNDNDSDDINEEITLTFDSTNWYELQSVTVFGEDDNVVETGDFHTSNIEYSATGDPTYANLTIADQSIRIIDRVLEKEQTIEALAEGFLAVQDTLDNLELPIVGQMGVFGIFDEFLNELVDALEAQEYITADVLAETIGDTITAQLGVDELTVEVTDLSDTNVALLLSYEDTLEEAIALDTDLGLPALGLGIETSGDLELTLDYDLDLAFGINSDDGFYLDIYSEETDEDNDGETDNVGTSLTANASLALSNEFTATGNMAFLQVDFANGLDSGNSTSGTNISAEIDASFQNPNNANDKTLTLSELTDLRGTSNIFDFLQYELDGSAAIDFLVTTSVEGDTQFPSLSFNLESELNPLFNAANNSETSTLSEFTIDFTEIQMDFGEFIYNMVGPIITDVNDFLDESGLVDVIEFLTEEISLIETLDLVDDFDRDDDGGVNVLELALTIVEATSDLEDPKYQEFFDAVLLIADTADLIVDTLENFENEGAILLNFGEYSFDFNAADSNNDTSSLDPEEEQKEEDTLNDTALSTAEDDLENSTENDSLFEVFDKMDELGISFPLLEDPFTIINLFFGQDVDLVTYDVPELDLEFPLSAEFPIFTGINGVLEGSLAVSSDLEVGFDTFGFSQWEETGFDIEDSYLILDGIYLNDLDDEGEDVPELELNATIAAGVEVNAVVASVKATGGLEGSAELDVVDEGQYTGQSDGKFRISELVNGLSNPLSLLELSGELAAFLRLVVKVGIDVGLFEVTKKVLDEELARVTLFEFTLGGDTTSGDSSGSYIADGTVFFDGNFNQKLDPTEPFTTTDAYGHYVLEIPPSFDLNSDGVIDEIDGQLVSRGGVDSSSGVSAGTLIALPGSTIISPLTSLKAELYQLDLDPDAAETLVLNQLGLEGIIDLDSFDALEAVGSNEELGLDTYLNHVKIQALFNNARGFLHGLQQADPTLAVDGNNLQNVLEAVAQFFIDRPATEPWDLNDMAEVRPFFQFLVDRNEVSATAAQIDAITQIVTDSNSFLDEATAVAQPLGLTSTIPVIASVKRVMQGDLPAIARQLGNGNFTPPDALAEFDSTINQNYVLVDADINAFGNRSVDITVDADSVNENEGAIAQFSINLSDPAPNQGLNLFYAIDGTASEGQDYDLPGTGTGQLFVAPDETQVTIDVTILDDNASKGLEALTLTLVTVGEGYLIDPLGSSATLRIIDDEPPLEESLLDLSDVIEGTIGNDNLTGTEDSDWLDGKEGNDEIAGEGSSDLIFGGYGLDILSGGDGNDVILGHYGDDSLFGEAGDDELRGGSGGDFLDGGPDNDIINGLEGPDRLFGRSGADRLIGGQAIDLLDGGFDNDILEGGSGADLIIGGPGDDLFIGGDDNDLFVLNLPNQGFDRIFDFDPDEGDVIYIVDSSSTVTLDQLRFVNGILDLNGENLALIQNEDQTYAFFPNLEGIIQIVSELPPVPTNPGGPGGPGQGGPGQGGPGLQPQVADKVVTEGLADDPADLSQDLLTQILDRGWVRVAITEFTNGYNRELASGLAAALFGDPTAIEFAILPETEILAAVASGHVDISYELFTPTLESDAAEGIDFGPNVFYNSQVILFKPDAGITDAFDLEGKNMGIVRDSAGLRELNQLLSDNSINANPIFFDSLDDLVRAYDDGEVDAIVQDYESLRRFNTFSNANSFNFLDLDLAVEPKAPVIAENQSPWADVVRWVSQVPSQAEELDIFSRNLERFVSNSTDDRIRRFLGNSGNLGEQLGVRSDFAFQVLDAVGNAEDLFIDRFDIRHRNRNHLWINDGLVYGAPFSDTDQTGELLDNDSRDVLAEVRARGRVNFGIVGDRVGFSAEANGELTGFDVDLGKALAAAVFGDATAVEFIEQGVNSGDRLLSVANGAVDVATASHTLGRDASLGVDFSPAYLYTELGVLVRTELAISSTAGLNGLTIGFVETDDVTTLRESLEQLNVSFAERMFESDDALFAAYDNSEIDAVAQDATALAARIPTLSEPDAHQLFDDEFIAKMPLALATDENQSAWADVVRWVVYTLVKAEELGITADNVDQLLTSDNVSDEVSSFLGITGDAGAALGLSNDFAANIIRTVGNYAEIYNRHFDSSILRRDRNESFEEFGVQIAPATSDASSSAPGDIILDIDGNGVVGAFSDGVLALRYLDGETGDALIDGAIAPDAARNADEIIDYLNSIRDTVLDVDGNGMAEGPTDGILFFRYLTGLTGDALIDGAIGLGATRTAADDIIAHLESFIMPTLNDI